MWEEIKLIDVTSAFIGVTTPISELRQRIEALGWEVDSSDFSKDAYVAKASNSHKQKAEAKGNTEATALGNLLKEIEDIRFMMAPYTPRVAAYGESFINLTEEIAQEYCDIKSYDKKAAQAWMELAEDCRRRVEIIQDEIDIEVTDNPMPYKSYSEMAEDILENGKFTVSRANASHPIWSINQVVDFRIAHDILGHAASGGDWSWFGINRAFEAHANLLSYTAQKALFTETVGQGAFHYYYGSYSTPKIAFMTIFDHPEGQPEPYKNAVHPSQTVVPKAMTKIPQDELIEKFGSIEDITDPNDGYETGIDPLDNNAYAWHRVNVDGRMVDPLHGRGYRDVVNGIKSNWHELDEASQEQAVANAFRNAFLKPGKHERGHAQHYQSVNHLPGSVEDPHRYWDAMTKARDSHNTSRGYLNANKELNQYLMPLKRHIKFINPDMRDDKISDIAEHHLLNMRAEEEREVKKKLGNDANAEDIHRDATRRLAKRLKRMSNDRAQEDYDFDDNRIFFSKHNDPSLYPSPLAHHVKPISDISKNIKSITKDALEDIKKGGKGHHFRSSIMKKYFTKDMEPHQIDEAWHYLAPETNQLGIVTPKISQVLGRKKGELSLRDYFKAERELKAARDASGYGHMPLGQFSKSLKNTMHQPTGHHPDKKHLHNLHPTPHTDIDWASRPKKAEKPKVPKWFNDTKKARKQVAKDWDKAEGISHPKDSIPFKKKTSSAVLNTFNPFYIHPDSKEKVTGKPNQSLMQHMRDSLSLSTPEIWALNPETGKEAANNGDSNS